MSEILHSTVKNILEKKNIPLRRDTRMEKNTVDGYLHARVFGQLKERAKACRIIIDEIYVKAFISFSGSLLFGYKMDDPTKKATPLLAMCMFLTKLIPCSGLKADFQFQCVQEILLPLKRSGAKVVAVIKDNNRMNQAFFRLFSPISTQTSWMAPSATDEDRPMFLLFDPVHLIKNFKEHLDH